MSQQIVNHDSFCNKYNIATAGVDLLKMADRTQILKKFMVNNNTPF